jgi:hypothetical protein
MEKIIEREDNLRQQRLIEELRKDGLLLRKVVPKLRNTELCIVAILQNSMALQY